MELAKWLVQWTLNLASRIRCSPRTIYMIHRMTPITPGKVTVTQKLEFCMTKLYMLARAHVLHCSHAPFPTSQVNLNNYSFQISSVIISCLMFGPLESFNGKPLAVACSCHLVEFIILFYPFSLLHLLDLCFSIMTFVLPNDFLYISYLFSSRHYIDFF